MRLGRTLAAVVVGAGIVAGGAMAATAATPGGSYTVTLGSTAEPGESFAIGDDETAASNCTVEVLWEIVGTGGTVDDGTITPSPQGSWFGTLTAPEVPGAYTLEVACGPTVLAPFAFTVAGGGPGTTVGDPVVDVGDTVPPITNGLIVTDPPAPSAPVAKAVGGTARFTG